jgi:hypothetical protein
VLLALLVSLGAGAQDVFVNNTNAALKTVIEDYPNHFSNIKGDPIATNKPAVDYKSKVIIPGSVNCTLTESKTNEAYSWKCELFTSTDFQKAKNQFNELYKEIHNTIIKIGGEKPTILNGQYAAPAKDKKHTTIFFHFLPNTELVQKLHVELQLQLEGGSWIITLQVYEEAPETGTVHAMA